MSPSPLHLIHTLFHLCLLSLVVSHLTLPLLFIHFFYILVVSHLTLTWPDLTLPFDSASSAFYLVLTHSAHLLFASLPLPSTLSPHILSFNLYMRPWLLQMMPMCVSGYYEILWFLCAGHRSNLEIIWGCWGSNTLFPQHRMSTRDGLDHTYETNN